MHAVFLGLRCEHKPILHMFRKTIEKQHSGMQKHIVCEQVLFVHIHVRLFVRIFFSWDSDKQLRISP